MKSKKQKSIEILETAVKHSKQKHFVTKDSIIYAKSMMSAMCGASGDDEAETLIERAIVTGVSEHGSDLDSSKMTKV